MLKYRKFTQEYRDEAVLMVIQSQLPILTLELFQLGAIR